MALHMPDNAIHVLDSGWVALLDSMGDDDSVEFAARQSYGHEEERKKSDRDKLIHYLMRNHHDTPFESVELEFQLVVPIFVARQIQRHRTFTFNELSGRYMQLQPTFYVPKLEDITGKQPGSKQGRGGYLEVEAQASAQELLEYSYDTAYGHYQDLLGFGVAEELARLVLPLGTYTVFGMKGNLRNWLHFLSLRTDSHAQQETQEVARAVEVFIADVVPVSYAAWKLKNAREVESRREANLLRE